MGRGGRKEEYPSTSTNVYIQYMQEELKSRERELSLDIL
jgi:hypothetical protein